MDHRRIWQCRFGLGAVRPSRHAALHRSAPHHAPLVGHQAPDRRPVRRAGRLAGKQPGLEQQHEQLQGAMALPLPAHAEVQAPCYRDGGYKARSSPAVGSRYRRIS